jgi:SAM-dependent methyltransferase
MSTTERVYWDSHYRQQRGTRDYPSPDPILFEHVPPLLEPRVYRALDLACGYAQNAIWIAQQGYRTDAMDISRVALAVAQVRAAKANVKHLNLLPVDLDETDLHPQYYDVAVVFRFIKRGLMPMLRACVRPGGRVIYQAPNTQYLHQAPDYDPEQLFRVGELIGYFADWDVLHNSNIKGISQLVVVKPGDA